MKVTERKYFDDYSHRIGNKIAGLIQCFDFSDGNGGFDYLTKASAVYSANIEGNSIDLNSYMNYELSKEKFKSGKEIDEIEQLIKAYEFAQKNELTEQNMLYCHQILSETFLIKSKRGHYRIEPVGVFGKAGIVYIALEPEFVEKQMQDLFNDIGVLINCDLTEAEVFYFASLIHLRFAHIHPFRDGNGRVARLIEKWFVAIKLGHIFWKLPSERYYKEHQAQYYESINLGVNFYELNYDNCINFLEMLPSCLI